MSNINCGLVLTLGINNVDYGKWLERKSVMFCPYASFQNVHTMQGFINQNLPSYEQKY